MSICGRSGCFCRLEKLVLLYFPDAFLSQTGTSHTDRSAIFFLIFFFFFSFLELNREVERS